VPASDPRPPAPAAPEEPRSGAATQAVSTLRPGQDVVGVFACTRKDRLATRTGAPYLALELRDRTGTIEARAFRDADALAARFDRGDLVRVVGRVERFRDALQVELRKIDRAEGVEADPSRFLPVAYRDLDELDGFLEHLAREVYDPHWRCGRSGAARRARGAAITPTSAGCSSTPSPWPPWRRSSASSTCG
jgi:3'-5' exoribonuclease